MAEEQQQHGGGQEPPEQPRDISRFFSAEARRLNAASLSGLLAKFAGVPDLVPLHVGIVPPASFPLSALHLDLADAKSGGQGRVSVTSKATVDAAQQYQFGPGHPALLSWISSTTKELHAPPAPYECAVTSGAVHALSLACSMLLDPGEWLLVDEFTYAHATEVVFAPKGARLVHVRMDAEGMDPGHLEAQIAWATAQVQQWRQQQGAGQRPGPGDPTAGGTLPLPQKPPRVLYLIPTGHNPTGITMSAARKRQLYEVARRHDLLIVEDDAYCWLAWGEEPCSLPPGAPSPAWQPAPHAAPVQAPAARAGGGAESEGGGWHRHVPRSFLSLDVDGRVLRVDTLAKVLGPGFRIGWVTGPPALVRKLALAVQASSVGSSPMVQVMVAELLAAWGPEGWAAHLARLRDLYRHKARVLEAAMAKHLAGLASWRGVPGAGMFAWLQFAGLGPVAEGENAEAAPARAPDEAALASALLDSRVVAVPGALSWTDAQAVQAGKPCPFLRLCFAVLEPEQLEEGVRRLAQALRALA